MLKGFNDSMTSFIVTDEVNPGLRRRDINFLRKWEKSVLRNLY